MSTAAEDLIEEDRFETSQTLIAAYLVYCGRDLIDLQWEHGTCTFFFENTLELQHYLSEFVSLRARVEPQSFNNAFVNVRNRMFAARPPREGT